MNKRVLLIEDDRVSRETLTKLLLSLGNTVLAVSSAEEAKRLLEPDLFDIALLDIRLPGLSGDSFGIYLKRKCPNTRIIFISGEHRVDDLERFGPDVIFLRKPLDFNELVAQLQ